MNGLRQRLWAVASYCRSNRKLLIALSIILALVLFHVIGSLVVDPGRADPLSGAPCQPPSREYLLGTDFAGRQLMEVIIVGMGLTLRIGVQAALMGLVIGTFLGFVSGFYGGRLDTVIKGAADVLIPLPSLLVLVVLAAMIPGVITLEYMVLVVGGLSWMWPTRVIRAQVLSMREKAYIQVARLSGMTNLEVIFKEMMPNLLPFLGASFVGTTAAAVLATIGLEALGLGPQHLPTLGMTIHWAIVRGAVFLGMWWWWMPPIVIIVVLFVGLFLLTIGLDEIANPRLKETT